MDLLLFNFLIQYDNRRGLLGQFSSCSSIINIQLLPLFVYSEACKRYRQKRDPVNIILVANHSTITKDFLKGGWKIPDPITKQTSLKISIDCILGRPYPTAPVSNLYLYGRKQDLTFELSGTTARTRDHIRLWNTKDTFEGQEIWVGSATHDAGIEISHTDDVPTHHISSNVDQERNFIMSELKPYICSEFLLPYAKPVQNAENGGGDHYHTDGKVAILLASLSLNKDNFHLSQLK